MVQFLTNPKSMAQNTGLTRQIQHTGAAISYNSCRGQALKVEFPLLLS